jgi:tetratricopeptide (TPR) repeat protein
LLVVDDIHAADNASTAILHTVIRKLTHVQALVIFAGRTSELRLSGAPSTLTSDVSIEGMRCLELDVLLSDAASQLVTRVLGNTNRSDPPLDRLVRASGGNPLAIELLTREWADNGASTLLRDLEALDTQPVPVMGIPRAISAVFERQSRRLHSSHRAALDLAAVLGRRLAEVDLYEAIGLPVGAAAESLSRLKDEGFLREIRGDLEFRNELIRAQAYYSVTAAARQHLHRRIAELLSARHSPDDGSIGLEVAWHHIRGGDFSRAIPFALHGSKEVIAVGAPHAAEEILSAIVAVIPPSEQSSTMLLLLARALVEQSKADPALPIIERLTERLDLTKHEEAELAMLRASAEFASNRNPGVKYCEAAKAAFLAARHAHDASLVSRALFECARAGSEEGLGELVEAAERGIDELSLGGDSQDEPMTTLTKAYCRFFHSDLRGALECLMRFRRDPSPKANAAQLAFIYSGIGLTTHFLGDFSAAYAAYAKALDLLRNVGDDARVSVMAANLCTLQTHRGLYDDAIRYGLMAVKLGEASSCSTLLIGYTNLMDPYMILGREGEAVACLERARTWLLPERRWRLHFTFLLEAASFALIQGNYALALDLVAQLETVTRGRGEALTMQGAYWKMRVFQKAHLGKSDEAHRIILRQSAQWKGTCPIYYLDMIAAKAWLETRETGRVSSETEEELEVFDQIGATGRRALLTLQGFLQPAGRPSTPLVSAGINPNY